MEEDWFYKKERDHEVMVVAARGQGCIVSPQADGFFHYDRGGQRMGVPPPPLVKK